MGVRRKSREIALQALYQAEMCDSDESFATLCENFEVPKKAVPYARTLVDGVRAHRREIDDMILSHARNWRLERMSVVDRNLLRIGVFELIYLSDEVPATVVINEAIEIAKRFSADDSPSFINGILDAVRDGSRQEKD